MRRTPNPLLKLRNHDRRHFWRGLLFAWLGLGLTLCGRAALQEKERAELEQLKRLLPACEAFDRWLEKYGYLPPDYDVLPAQPYPQELLTMVRDGKEQPVTAQDWPERRKEIQALTEDWLVGHAPPAPGNVRAVIEEKKKEEGLRWEGWWRR